MFRLTHRSSKPQWLTVTNKPSLFSSLRSAFLSKFGSASNSDNSTRQEQPRSKSANTSEQQRKQLPVVSQMESMSVDFDSDFGDDISVISLGEGPQLRIDGSGINTTPPNNICDNLSKPTTTAGTASPNKSMKTLSPIEPVYHKKAMSKLNKLLENGNVADGEIPNTGLEKEREARKDDSTKSSPQATPHIAEIDELRKRISEMELTINSKNKQISQLIKNEDSNAAKQKLVKSFKSTDRKLKKMKSEVLILEHKVAEKPAIQLSGSTKSDGRAVSDTNTALTVITRADQVPIIFVKPATGSRVISFTPQPTETASVAISPRRPTPAVRRFSLAPDKTTITPGERMMKERLKIERELTFGNRQQAAYPSSFSATENIRGQNPYKCKNFDRYYRTRNIVNSQHNGFKKTKKFEQLNNTEFCTTSSTKLSAGSRVLHARYCEKVESADSDLQ